MMQQMEVSRINHDGTVEKIAASEIGVTVSGTIDRLRLTSTSTDTFDAGSVNILYE